MTVYTYSQLETVWLDAAKGTKYDTSAWAALMAAIAMAESGGNSNATNPNDNGGTQTSWGLWQISLGNHEEPASNWDVASENAALAIGKLNSQGLSAWGTYDSGAYEQYLQSGVSPSSLPTASGSTSAETTSLTSSLNPLSGIVQPITTISSDFDDLLKVFHFLSGGASAWVRIGAFFMGMILLVGAIWCFVRASDDSPLLPQSLPAIPVPV